MYVRSSGRGGSGRGWVCPCPAPGTPGTRRPGRCRRTRPRRASRRWARAVSRPRRCRRPSTGNPRDRAFARAAAAVDPETRRGDPRTCATPSQDAEILVDLVRRDVCLEVFPFLALVADHVVEHVLTERLGDELGRLHDVDGFLERLREGADALGGALLGGHLVDVV